MSAPDREVVVTGVGLVCPLGDSLDAVHEALCHGRRAWRTRSSDPDQVDPADLPELPVADLADFAPADYLGAANFRPLDRTSQLSASAARLALTDAGWSKEQLAASEVGLVLGTMFGSLSTISGFDRRGLTAGPAYVKPFQFANSVINAAAGQTAIWHDLRGVNATISGDTDGVRVQADHERLAAIFTHLIRNAQDASMTTDFFSRNSSRRTAIPHSRHLISLSAGAEARAPSRHGHAGPWDQSCLPRIAVVQPGHS